MQVTLNDSAYKTKLYRLLQYLLTLGALWWIGQSVSWEQVLHISFVSPYYALLLTVVVVLMPVNWLLESKKWEVLLSTSETISLHEAFRQVMNGVVYGWVLPFTSGDVLARLEHASSKIRAAKSIFFNRFASFLVAVLFGAIGVLYYFQWVTGYLPMIAVCVLISVSYVFLMKSWSREMAQVFLLSVIRFLVLSIQFYILIRLFTTEGDFSWVFAGISWVFLLRSVVPSLWGAVGVREVSAVLFFSCCMDTEVIVTSSLLLWFINLVLPSILFIPYKMWYLRTERMLSA